MVKRKFIQAFLLVSLVFVGIALLPINSNSKLGYSFDLFVLFVLLWAVLTICTPIVLGIRFLSNKKLPTSLYYHMLCIANGEMGLYGLWELFQANVEKDFGWFLTALLISVAFFIVMLVDIFNS